MKLSEALAQRADIQKRIQQLLERARMNAVYQDGTEPAEDSNALLAEVDELCTQLEDMIQRINRTNSATKLEGDRTISDVIATRDVLKLRIDAMRQVADSAVATPRHGHAEILSLTKINVRTLRKSIDALMKEYRTVDQAIQAANWSTDLLG